MKSGAPKMGAPRGGDGSQGRSPGGTGQEAGKPQTGDKNASAPKKPGTKKQVEVIDKATGQTHVEYRDDGAGSADPEAKPSPKGV